MSKTFQWHQGKDGLKSIGNVPQPNTADLDRSAPIDAVGPSIETPKESPGWTHGYVQIGSDPVKFSKNGPGSPKKNLRTDYGRG